MKAIMKRIVFAMISVLCLLAGGCASQMETANRGASTAGETAGGAARLPNSFMEGAASGIAGQPTANPYNR